MIASENSDFGSDIPRLSTLRPAGNGIIEGCYFFLSIAARREPTPTQTAALPL